MRWSSADSSDLQGLDYDRLARVISNMHDALFRLACMLSSARPTGSLAMRCRRTQRGDDSKYVNILSGLPDGRLVTFAWKDIVFVWPWYQTSRSTWRRVHSTHLVISCSGFVRRSVGSKGMYRRKSPRFMLHLVMFYGRHSLVEESKATWAEGTMTITTTFHHQCVYALALQ